MAQKIRLWAVADNETPKEVEPSPIRLEKRLHDWLENDISMLDEGLLVIGREVEAHDRGRIDLLCIDAEGDLVVVELKQGKTPREVAAQALDYASWAKDLTADDIEAIAEQYARIGSLQEALRERFGSPPSTLNENHRSLIVAEAIDESTERIVRYLSELGVPVNVATVQAFQDANGQETLAQVFLVEPEVARDRARSAARKRPYRTVREIDELAVDSGLDHLYQRLQGVRKALQRQPYWESMGYYWRFKDSEGRSRQTTVLMVNVAKPDSGGLGFEIHATRLNDHLEIPLENLRTMLPGNVRERSGGSWRGSSPEDTLLIGAFHTSEEVDTFVAKLTESVERLDANVVAEVT